MHAPARNSPLFTYLSPDVSSFTRRFIAPMIRERGPRRFKDALSSRAKVLVGS